MQKVMDAARVKIAQGLREAGVSYRQIARQMGVSDDTVMTAVDPIYAQSRLQRKRDRRRLARPAAKPRPKPVAAAVRPTPPRIIPPKSAEAVELGLYSVPEGKERETGRHGDGCRMIRVSLPYVSILHGGRG